MQTQSLRLHSHRTRFVANEAHAFVETYIPTKGWKQINLGGCGTTKTLNPYGYEPYPLPAEQPKKATEIETRTFILGWPKKANKQQRVSVFGQVVDIYGKPVVGSLVKIHLSTSKTDLSDATPIGSGVTNSSGVFQVLCTIPPHISVGEYQLVAVSSSVDDPVKGLSYKSSRSDPSITVVSGCKIILSAPAVWAAGVPLRLGGRLLEEGDIPVASASIHISSGHLDLDAQTSQNGSFAIVMAINETGEITFNISFSGDKYHSPCSNTTTLLLRRFVLAVPDVLAVIRGQQARLAGTVEPQGVPIRSKTVSIHLFGRVYQTELDPRGSFEMQVQIPTTVGLGKTTAVYYLGDDKNPSAVQTILTYCQPELRMQSTPSALVGEPLYFRCQLADDNGLPMNGENLSAVLLDSCNKLVSSSWNITNGHGSASFALETNDAQVGVHNLTIRFLGSGYYLPAQLSTVLLMRSDTVLSMELTPTVTRGSPIEGTIILRTSYGAAIPAIVNLSIAEEGGKPIHIPSVKTNSTGIASVSIQTSNLQPRTYHVEGMYGGDSLFNPSQANSTIILKENTTLTIDCNRTLTRGMTLVATVRLCCEFGGVLMGNVSVLLKGPQRDPSIHQVVNTSTNSKGTVSIAISTQRFPSGTYAMAARYGGDARFNPSYANISLDILENTSIRVECQDSATRGTPLPLQVWLESGDGSAVDGNVSVRLASQANPDEGIEGKIHLVDGYGEINLSTESLVPGSYLLSAEFERTRNLGSSRATKIVQVRENAFLVVDFPSNLTAGSVVTGHVLLRSEYGTTIQGRVQVDIASLKENSSLGAARTILTDSYGEADFNVSTGRHWKGTHTLTCRFQGDELYNPSSCSKNVEVLPRKRLFFYILAGVVPGTILPAYLVKRRLATAKEVDRKASASTQGVISRETNPAPSASQEALVEKTGAIDREVVDTRVNTQLSLQFPDLDSCPWQVWGMNEPLLFEVTISPSEPARLTMQVRDGDTKSRQIIIESGGKTSGKIEIAHEGEVVLSMAFDGDEYRKPAYASRSIRIVDYRKEIQEEYQSLVAALMAGSVRSSESERLTPREIEYDFLSRHPDGPKDAIEAVMWLFEYTNYGKGSVSHRHYVEFMGARDILTAFLGKPSKRSRDLDA